MVLKSCIQPYSVQKHCWCNSKIIHYITATRDKLFWWNIVDSDICTFCNEEIETLPHLLIECEAVKLSWIDMNNG